MCTVKHCFRLTVSSPKITVSERYYSCMVDIGLAGLLASPPLLIFFFSFFFFWYIHDVFRLCFAYHFDFVFLFFVFIGIDPLLWQQAKLDNPDPEKYIPVPMIGFKELQKRLRLQAEQTRLYQQRLDVSGNGCFEYAWLKRYGIIFKNLWNVSVASQIWVMRGYSSKMWMSWFNFQKLRTTFVIIVVSFFVFTCSQLQ